MHQIKIDKNQLHGFICKGLPRRMGYIKGSALIYIVYHIKIKKVPVVY